MSTNFVTMIYICVCVGGGGVWVCIMNMAFDIYRENRRVGLIHLTNLCTRIQFV